MKILTIIAIIFISLYFLTFSLVKINDSIKNKKRKIINSQNCLYNKGEYIMFIVPQIGPRWLFNLVHLTRNKTSEVYITSYIGQGNIKTSYELKNGDILKIKESAMGFMIVEPINIDLPKNEDFNLHASSLIFKNCGARNLTQEELNSILRKIRKDKTQKINNIK